MEENKRLIHEIIDKMSDENKIRRILIITSVIFLNQCEQER